MKTKRENLKLNNSALVEKIAQNSRFKEEEISLFMKALQFSVKDALVKEGDIVHLQGIGKFQLVTRKGKADHLTGVRRVTKDKLVIQFTASKGLKTWNTDDLA